MVHDIEPKIREVVASSDYFRTLIELRRGIIVDHVVDTLARAYALEIRLGGTRNLYSPPERRLIKDMTRVTYG